MAIFKSILYFSMLANYVFIKGEIYSTCYVDESYCLFSFGTNVTVNNVKEAQKICEDAKNGSWLLEIDDNKINNVKEFLPKHSFPNDTKLILKNGKKYNFNKKDSSGGEHSTTDSEEEDKKFHFVCVADCPFKFDLHKDTRYIGATNYPQKSKEQCLELCNEFKCEAYEWDSKLGNDQGCWIHKKINGNMSSNSNSELYVRNMSPRTEKCLGDVKDPFQKDSTVVIILLILIMVAIICFALALVFWRRRKRRDQTISAASNICNQTSRVPNNQVNQISDIHPATYGIVMISEPILGNHDASINGLVYADLVHPKKVLNSNPKGPVVGPMGDVYAQVNR